MNSREYILVGGNEFYALSIRDARRCNQSHEMAK